MNGARRTLVAVVVLSISRYPERIDCVLLSAVSPAETGLVHASTSWKARTNSAKTEQTNGCNLPLSRALISGCANITTLRLSIAYPTHRIATMASEYHFDEKQEQVAIFEKIKEYVCDVLILAYPGPSSQGNRALS